MKILARRKLKKGVVKIFLEELRNTRYKDKDITLEQLVESNNNNASFVRSDKNDVADERNSLLFAKPEVNALKTEEEENSSTLEEIKEDFDVEERNDTLLNREEDIKKPVEKIIENTVVNNVVDNIEESVKNDTKIEESKKRRCKKVSADTKSSRRKVADYTVRKLEYEQKKMKNAIEIDKVYDKAKEVASSKIAKKVLNISVIACSTVFAVNFVDKISRKIVLEVDAQEVSWVMNKSFDTSSYEYELFRDGKRALVTKATKYMEPVSTDTESPDKITSIKLNKNNDVFTFSWKEPKDNGVELNYKIKATNKGFGKSYESRELNAEIISGVEKYIINIDGKKYESVTPNFNVDINSLKYGSHTLEVSAIDYAGNVSKSKKIDFKVDNTKFFIDDYKLATNNPDITDETYDLYLVKEREIEKDGKKVLEKEKLPIKLGDYISTYFINRQVPEISNPRYLYESDLLNITWEENTFGANDTDFYIECKSKKGIKSYKSEKMNYGSGDFLPGYYYQVNKDPLYTVNKTDSYTMDNNVSLDYNRYDKTKIYYFHVASANEYGNLSKTKTLELDLKNFTTNGEKKDAVREILYRTKGLESDAFRKITDDIYNTFTLNTIKKLKDIGLKIVVMQEDVTDYVLSNHNAKVINKNICYIKEDKTIVYNTKYSLGLLIKHIVKVLDEFNENPISKNIDYLNVYNTEKKTLKEGKLSAQDYLAEAVKIYIEDAHMLKTTSPKTYEYIKTNYKTIMFA